MFVLLLIELNHKYHQVTLLRKLIKVLSTTFKGIDAVAISNMIRNEWLLRVLGRAALALICGVPALAYVERISAADALPCAPGDEVFTANGDRMDLRKTTGLHLSIRSKEGVCRIEALEGLIWWRDGVVTASPPLDKTGWTPFKVAFGFLQSPGINRESVVPRGLLRAPNWNGLVLNPKKYPGLQIRLKYGIDINQPSKFNGNFVLEEMRGQDGRMKIITCSIVATSLATHKGSIVPKLLGEQLVERNFDDDYDLCELDLLDFALKDGAGRITFSIEHLHSAPLALPAIFEYIESLSIAKGA